MRHTRMFANLCNAGVKPQSLAVHIDGCPTPAAALMGTLTL